MISSNFTFFIIVEFLTYTFHLCVWVPDFFCIGVMASDLWPSMTMVSYTRLFWLRFCYKRILYTYFINNTGCKKSRDDSVLHDECFARRVNIWEWVKIAWRQICTKGQFCTKTNLHKGTKLHNNNFTWRVNCAHVTVLHGESFLHKSKKKL